MRPTATSFSALCAIAILAAGCASPQSHFYTLSRTVAPTATATPTPLNVSVVVGPVSIPAIVDLPQIVVSTGPNQVSLDEFNRWASPLQVIIFRGWWLRTPSHCLNAARIAVPASLNADGSPWPSACKA
jgi:ABC-type uncharacterized transport system auxiliary subunit